MKTVLHLSSTSGPGGAERVISLLASSLDRSRYRSIVCLFRPGWLKEQCEARGVQTYILPMYGRVDWRWVVHARQFVKREQVSLIHAHEFTGNVYGCLLARITGVPIITTVHGKNYYWEQGRRRLAYRLASRYATMVAVSADLKRFIVKQVGVPHERINVIYNGIDIPEHLEPTDPSPYRSELGLCENDPVIGTVGSLYPVKGHKYLIGAAPLVLKNFPRATFLVIGRGELEVSLKEQARELGLERQVRFLGLRHDVPKLLSLMDIFIMPSLSEGLSLALLEAMAAGLPVVVTNVGGNPELVLEGETGYLVPPCNPEALASRLISMLQDRVQAKRLGQNGRQHVLEYFTLTKMLNNYQQLYENCLRA